MITGRLIQLRVFHDSSARLSLFWKLDCTSKPANGSRSTMASAADSSTVNFIIAGDEDSQMDGQNDPIREERQEEMYTHVFEGQSIPSVEE